MHKRWLLWFMCTLLAASAGTQTSAQVILDVVVSNTLVTFNSTTEFAQANAGPIDAATYGINLNSFFVGNTAHINTPLTGTINTLNAPSGTTRDQLDYTFADTGSPYTGNELVLYRNTSPTYGMYFNTSTQALTGSATSRLTGTPVSFSTGSSFSVGFQSTGTTGNVVAGDPVTGTVVGQWRLTNNIDPGLLLEIDASDLSAVTFTATYAFATATTSATDGVDGLTLLNFFSGNSADFVSSAFPSGGLAVCDDSQYDSRFLLNHLETQDRTGAGEGGWTTNDLQFWGGNTSMFFNTARIALDGSVTYDFTGTALADDFLAAGTTGSVITGTPDSPTTLGTWKITASVTPVPEPSTLALLLAGSLGMWMRQRRAAA